MKTNFKTDPTAIRKHLINQSLTPAQMSAQTALSSATVTRLLNRPCKVTYRTAAALTHFVGTNAVTTI